MTKQDKTTKQLIKLSDVVSKLTSLSTQQSSVVSELTSLVVQQSKDITSLNHNQKILIKKVETLIKKVDKK